MSAKKTKVVERQHKQAEAVAYTASSPLAWYYYVIPPSLVALVSFVFYFPSRNYDFQFDDIANITKYYDIRRSSFWDIFFTDRRWICRWLNSVHYSIGKFEPYSYRIVNIIQHILLGAIVFYFFLVALRHLKRQSFFKEHAFPIAVLVGGLFSLHPVQTQTVSYVIQGKLEGVATFFIVSMAFCFLLAYTVQSRTLALALKLFYFVLAALACGSKEIAIMAPFLVALVDWFFVAQGSWQEMRSRWVFHLCSFLTVYTIYLWFLRPEYFTAILTLQMKVPNNLGNVITNNPLDHITPGAYLISEFKVILHYLWIFIWPFNMSVEYDWVLSKGFFAPDCLFPFLALVLVGYVVYRLLRSNPTHLVAFGIIWFMICIAPRSTIIPSAELLVDYKTYAASVGWLFVLASGLVWLSLRCVRYMHTFTRIPVPVSQGIATVICIVGLGYATMDRNTVWRSGLEFWGNMLKNAPGKARIYNNYGVELSQKLQKFNDAIPYFKKAIAMDSFYSDPHNNLAVVYAYLGQTDDAINQMKEGLRLNPNYPEGYNNLAAFYMNKRKYDEAIVYLGRALKIRPNYGKAFFNRARAYTEQGSYELALADLKSACTRADLDNSFGFSSYGKFALQHKYFDDAIFAFGKFIELEPQNPEGYSNLATAYHMAGKLALALQTYEHVLAMCPGDMRSTANAGEVCLRNNEFDKALSYLERVDLKSFPQVALSIAACYAKLGKIDASKRTLNELIALPVPDELKENAKVALANLNTKGALA